MVNLDALIEVITSFAGVTRKRAIRNVTDDLKDVYNVGGKTLLNFGDDASAIEISDNQLVLLAADGIWGPLMDADPYWAGYCSVLVNVNDIAAMGGKPLGMTNILSINNLEVSKQVIKGICDGAKKFGVPMVGGHMHPDAPNDSLDVSITGIVDKDALITSFGANVGDKVLITIDLDGQQYPTSPLNWDTTSFKDSKIVQAQINMMNVLGSKKLVTAGKDISNPGILGTLGMLLETSNKGATVELTKIPKNENVDWEDWLRVYPGAGFVLTIPPECEKECITLLNKVNMTSAVVGEVISEEKLYLTHKNTKKVLFDFKRNGIVGIREE